MKPRILIPILVASLALVACKKKAPPTQPTPTAKPHKTAPAPAPAPAPTTAKSWKEGLKSKDANERIAALGMVPVATLKKIPAAVVAALSDSDEGVRKAAIGAAVGFILQYVDDSVLSKLLDIAAKDASAAVRAEAVRASGNLTHKDVVPRLVALYGQEKDGSVRGEILAVLARSGDTQALPIIRQALEEKEPALVAFDALRTIETQVTPALLKLTESGNKEIRKRAIQAVGEIGDPSGSAKLVEALGDKDPEIVRTAIDALSQIGSAEAVPKLLPLCDNADATVRAAAIRGLANYRKPEAVKAAEAMPKVLNHLKTDKTEEVRVAAAQALGTVRLKEALPTLEEVFADTKAPKGVRAAAVDAMGAIGDAAALPALAKALEDGDEDVRTAAARSIGMLGKAAASAAKALVARWKKNEPDLDAKAEILRALSKIGAVQTADLLKQVAGSDPVPILRVIAAGSLLRLERPEGIGAIRPLLIGAQHWQERREAARVLEVRKWRERAAAAKSTEGAKFAGAVAQLILDALKSEREPLVREVLFNMLAKARGPIAAKAQRRALKARVPFFRLMAAAGLCRNGGSRGCEILVAGLQSPEASVRAEAAKRIGWYRVKRARPTLEKLRQDSVVYVASAAKRALSMLDRPQQ